MDFSFSDEQRMLQDTTRRFIASAYSFEKRARMLASDQGWSRETWSAMADLGLLAVDVGEHDGGMGAGPFGTMLVAQAAGEGLLLEPLLSSVVLASQVISRSGSDAQRTRWLPSLADGSIIAVLAHEPNAMIDATAVSTRATRKGDGWQLQGRKPLVYHAPFADLLLVSARDDDGAIRVFAMASDAPGVKMDSFPTVDGQRAADIALTDVHVAAEDQLIGDAAPLQAAIDYALAMFCAEALGSLERLLDATIEHSRTRIQFGAPIGTFQALQHRMADMLMHVEQARSMVYLAVTHCTDTNASQRRKTLSAAKVLIGQAARFVSQNAIQLHGGMGMTDELDVSHHAKRLLAFELRFGSTDMHRASYRTHLQADRAA